MELAGLQEDKPSCRRRPESPRNVTLQHQETRSIKEPQNSPDNELCVVKPNKGNNGLADSGQKDGADKGPRNGAREGEVIVCAGQLLIDVRGWSAVDENIVRGLDVE